MSKYIKLGTNILRREKIVHANFRKSIMHIWYPYILEIKYSKLHKTTSYVNVGNRISYSVPMEHMNDTLCFKYKYIDKETLNEDLNKLKTCPNIIIKCEEGLLSEN